MFYIEWLGGRVEKYHSKQTWESKIAKYEKQGFHKDWDFYIGTV